MKQNGIEELESISFDFTPLHSPQVGRDCKPHPAWCVLPKDNNQHDDTVPSWGSAFPGGNLLRTKKTADFT